MEGRSDRDSVRAKLGKCQKLNFVLSRLGGWGLLIGG